MGSPVSLGITFTLDNFAVQNQCNMAESKAVEVWEVNLTFMQETRVYIMSQTCS